MFGIALTTILTHAAAVVAGGGIGAWFHAKWLQVKTAAEAEEASIKSRVAALEAAYKASTTNTTPPAA